VALIAFDARDAFVPMPHGSGIYVRRLLEALRRTPPAGHELWALEHGGPGPELWWEQVTLPRRLGGRRAALVHCPDSFLPLRRPCPAVVTIHDLGFVAIPGDLAGLTGWKYRTLVPRAARSAERVICPSRFTATDLSTRYGVDPERIRVIPEAPALTVQAAAADSAGAGAEAGVEPRGADAGADAGTYLLAAGDLRPKKNLPLLVEAYRRLRREGMPHRLVLAGADTGSADDLRRLAGSDPLELPGFVDDARLDALIRGADALIVPSLYEGFGLVALDAMARGCPVLLARAGALPETGGSGAVYFDPHDPADLAAAIRSVVEDRAERERLREAGRARAGEFSWERTAAATVAVYQELL
jgi:glycosyltransferase involved in cell wall biosynthesis